MFYEVFEGYPIFAGRSWNRPNNEKSRKFFESVKFHSKVQSIELKRIFLI